MNIRTAMLLVALPGLMAAQAAVETALGAGRAATTAAPARKVGKGIADALDKLNRTLAEPDKTTPAAASAKTRAVPASAKPAPKPAVTYENPAAIAEGIDLAELTRRFGPGSMTVTTATGEEMREYVANDLRVDVTIHEGKVSAVTKTGGPGI